MRTRDSSSPATDVAITSIAMGLSSGEMVNSKEKWPSALGMASLPLMLTVASGEEIPVIVMLSVSTTMSSGGKVTSNCNAAVCGTGDGSVVAAGSGADVGVGDAVGGVVAVGGGSGVATTAGITDGITEGTGVAAGVGLVFGVWTLVDGRATVGEEETGCPASVPAEVASSPPHAAVNKRIISAAAGSNLAGKVRTRIPTLP